MGFQFENLDQATRELMLVEIDRDLSAGTLYLSDNLTDQGQEEYPGLLREAAESGSDETLAMAIASRLRTHEKPRRLKSGGYSKPPVMRKNAHTMLAEGEFNRFYIRALCVRAIESGRSDVEVYRAKAVESARSASQQMIGQKVPAKAILEDLRANSGVDTALGLPPGPNSGLSVRI